MAADAVLRALRTATSAVLRAVLLGSALLTALWLSVVGTRRWRLDAYWRTFPPNFGCDNTRLLDACTLGQLQYMWALPLAAALASIALLALHATLRRPGAAAHRARAARLLPPRAFWAAWCGGLSACDAAFLLGYLAVNALWLAAIMARYQSLAPMFRRLARMPGWALEWQLVAVALGALLFPNLVILFYPIARGSVLLQALGLSYPEAIRYHRWVGHCTMAIATAHSLGFWAVWTLRGQWLEQALTTDSRVNNLAGGLSFLGGLALWVTSIEAVRRSTYALFYAVHHLGFWAFMVAGCIHFQGMFWFFLPGLLLYAVDAGYRLTQGVVDGGRASLLAAVAALDADATGGGVCSLALSAHGYGAAPTGFAWLHVPSISRLQWHPFEYVVSGGAGASVPPPAGGGAAPVLTMHIKAYDRWTRELVALVACKGAGFAVKLEGPYPELPAPPHPPHGGRGGEGSSPQRPGGLVFVAGGIGATAALSVLAELGEEEGRGVPALLLWAVRHPSELRLLAPTLLGAARDKGLQLTTRVFFTGPPAALAAASGRAASSPAAAADQLPPAKQFHLLVPMAAGGGGGGGGGGDGAAGRRRVAAEEARGVAAAATTPMCPVVAASGLWWQAQEKAAVHVAVFTGALAAILGVRWASTVAPTIAGGDGVWGTTRAGAAYALCVSVCALLAGALALHLSALLRWLSAGGRRRDGNKPGAAAAQPLLSLDGDDGEGGGGGFTAKAALAEVVQLGRAAAAWDAQQQQGEVVPIELGRPDLEQLLGSWLAGQRALPATGAGGARPSAAEAAASEVAVYAMGPEGLVGATRLLCDAHNRSVEHQRAPRRQPWLVFNQRTHEL